MDEISIMKLAVCQMSLAFFLALRTNELTNHVIKRKCEVNFRTENPYSNFHLSIAVLLDSEISFRH